MGAAGDLRRRPSQELWGDADIVPDLHVRKQADALEDVADAPPEQVRVDRPDRLAFDPDRALVGLDQTVDEFQRRRLARAGRSDQRDEGAGLDPQRDIVHRKGAPAIKGLANAFDLNDRGAGHVTRHCFEKRPPIAPILVRSIIVVFGKECERRRLSAARPDADAKLCSVERKGRVVFAFLIMPMDTVSAPLPGAVRPLAV